ncbi:MAG: DUF255 domain-containing protein [Caulobacter sp.]|nr:DUF255 domain-containing protein [Caulobacter sp.]
MVRLAPGPVWALALVLASASPAPVWAAAKAPPAVDGAPVVGESLRELRRPRRKLYDQAATPAEVNARLDAAFARARLEDKRVIVDLGGDWCGWCLVLAAVMDLPQVKPFIEDNFVVVPVYVPSTGIDDDGRKALKRFRTGRVNGYPWLIVAESNGKVLASSSEITDEANETPQAMVNWLRRWARRPAVAAAARLQ